MQLEIWSNEYLESLKDQFVDFPIVQKTRYELLQLWHHWDNCRCDQCEELDIWSYFTK